MVELANSYSIKPAFLCIDMEDADGYKGRNGMPSNETLKAICTAEGEIFENAGYYAIVYANSSWFKNQLAGLTRFDKWVAHWPVSAGKQKEMQHLLMEKMQIIVVYGNLHQRKIEWI